MFVDLGMASTAFFLGPWQTNMSTAKQQVLTAHKFSTALSVENNTSAVCTHESPTCDALGDAVGLIQVAGLLQRWGRLWGVWQTSPTAAQAPGKPQQQPPQWH
jgi:hypothetical protein